MSSKAVTQPQSAIAAPARLGRSYALVLVLALVFYGISVAPGVVWQDNGTIQVRVLERELVGALGLALSHALYYVIAIAFQSLPLTESALKTNLVSVVFGAVTIANIYLLLRLITGRKRGALIGTLSLAVAHTFWQHCALPETYTLCAALLSGELLCVYKYAATRRPGWLIWLFLLNGLGISNHMIASLSLSCYGVMLVVLAGRGAVRPKTIALAGLVWMVGAGLYLTLIAWRIGAGDGFGATIRSALFGAGFERNVLNVVVTPRQLLKSVLYLGLNYPTPAALFVFPGLAALWRTRYSILRNVLLGLLVIHLLWVIRYNVVDQYTFFVPTLVLLSIPLGLGADRVLAGRPRRWMVVATGAALLPAGVYAVLPGVARRGGINLGITRDVPYRDAYDYFLRPWKTGYHGGDRFAREAAAMLPPGSVLIADGTTVRPIQYYQLTHRWREDVRVFPPLPRFGTPSVKPTESMLADELDRGVVFVVTPQRGYCPQWLLDGYEFERQGVLYRVAGRKPPLATRPAQTSGRERSS